MTRMSSGRAARSCTRSTSTTLRKDGCNRIFGDEAPASTAGTSKSGHTRTPWAPTAPASSLSPTPGLIP